MGVPYIQVQPPPGEEDHKEVHQRLAEGKFD
jgi:hypothetical protein